MSIRRIVVFALLVCFAAFSTVNGAEPKRYIVTVRGPVGADVAALGGEVRHEFRLIKAAAVELPEGAAMELRARPNVIKVEEDAEVRALAEGAKKPGGGGGVPPQPKQSLPWGVNRIDAELAWAQSTGAGVKVAVVDTGIDGTHPDLAANVKGGVNFVRKGKTVDPAKWADDNGHGTHVAGIIAAANNSIGVVGVAPGASLYAVKVLDASGSGYVSDIIRGLEWATANGMKVINMSLGTSSDISALKAACDAAAASAVLVAAAGNDGGNVLFPARYSSVVAVGASDASDDVPNWSNRGDAMELTAPGVSVNSTWKGGGYQVLSGTSMATPHVAGTCALMLGVVGPPDLATLRDKLHTTADDIPEPGLGWDKVSGYGLVDAEEGVTGKQTSP